LRGVGVRLAASWRRATLVAAGAFWAAATVQLKHKKLKARRQKQRSATEQYIMKGG
jgi:hypothetical protein